MDLWNSRVTIQACRPAAMTYRQLDHWARQGYAKPTLEATSSGQHRGYSVDAIARVVCLAYLCEVGVPPKVGARALDAGGYLRFGEALVYIDADVVANRLLEFLGTYASLTDAERRWGRAEVQVQAVRR